MVGAVLSYDIGEFRAGVIGKRRAGYTKVLA
jgi:hypothetical protein